MTLKHTSYFLILCFCISCQFFVAQTTTSKDKLDLSGTWSFKVDSLDQGVKNNWYSIDFEQTITLPGSMAENPEMK